jgi:hypothetical protein
MDMFTVDESVVRWETALLPLRGPDRLEILLPLAWHLRQRDTRRALDLAAEALALLPDSPLSPAEQDGARLRMDLLQAEAAWLQGALDQALAQGT